MAAGTEEALCGMPEEETACLTAVLHRTVTSWSSLTVAVDAAGGVRAWLQTSV